MNSVLPYLLSLLICAGSAAPAFSQDAALEQTAALAALLKTWNLTPERFGLLSEEQQALVLKGLGPLEAGRRTLYAEIKRLRPDDSENYLTFEGHPNQAGRQLIAAAQEQRLAAISDLDLGRLGLTTEDVARINDAVHQGASGEQLAGQANALFDQEPPTGPRMVGELLSGGVGLTGGGFLIEALRFRDAALAFVDQAVTAKGAAEALALQARSAAQLGDLARAGQLSVQAKQAGVEALSYKEQAIAAGEKAKDLAHTAKILTIGSGALATLDGAWDLFQGARARLSVSKGQAVEESFLGVLEALARGEHAGVGGQIASAYFDMMGADPSSAQKDIVVQAFDDVAFAMPPQLAPTVAAMTRKALAELEKRGQEADERMVIGGVKISMGTLIILSALVFNPATGPWIAIAASLGYLGVSLYQHRSTIKAAFQWLADLFSGSGSDSHDRSDEESRAGSSF